MTALCRHFGTCGGCAFQDMAPESYAALKRELVLRALEREGLANVPVGDVVEIGPATRRRATLKAAKSDGVTLLGFNAAKSHAIVDMHECLVLTPGLAALIPGLRELMAGILPEGGKAELHLTQAENGVDLSLDGIRADAKLIARVAPCATRLKLARVTADCETLVEPAVPETTIGTARVQLTPDCFLQPTQGGEKILQDHVCADTAGAKTIVDLFCGCGTFTLPLAARARIHAVDSDRRALGSLENAVRRTQRLKPVGIEARDLFKLPLTRSELSRFDAVVLDPPRAGAAAQVREIAKSDVRRVVYVSCNPSSFARDARLLGEGGLKPGTVTPVDQFLWSSHIELVASFSRDK